VTAHRSQAKTVDFEIIAAERMARDLFYVSATRAREGLTVVTSDSMGLQESIGVSGDRQSAMELSRRAAAIARRPDRRHFAQVEDYQVYQARQQRPVQIHHRQIHQQEITQHASIRPHSGF
jgi:hypothetical protein